ncbi:MAG: ribonuclease R [Bacteroides sp.]|nr:ribonuclease R [Bacteroidales bacterium]MBD5250087.1 ribonuclease R [Barnesiella sp.]MBD5253306.1 ribonuclease R [Barnesiella sp.]MBD5345186.1 ribonuclease R [Bacteroides sp.]MBD5368732.1 ribonuclease R [Bacteroides sp.]
MNIKNEVSEFVRSQENNTYNYRQVSHAIGASTRAQQRQVAMILVDMAFNGEIIEVSPGKYKSPRLTSATTGTFVRRSNGKNSVVTDTDGETLFVAERNSMHALNGDKVKVEIAARRRGVEPEAMVVEILEKADQQFIGTLEVDKHFAYLLTDSKFLATDIFIPKTKLKGGVTGDKAIVKITEWKDGSKNPRGEVIDIIGKKGDNNTEMHAILAEFGLPYKYPEAVERAANKIQAGITPEEIAARVDMRDVTTFTIDPRDAKDFDDALSFRTLPDGNFEVGVHIADVTHYVHPDTIIDREASKRATSVYLVDRVVPMLPEHLCNGICSLRPNEEKLAFSVVFKMDSNARVLDYKICRTVIKSDRRFTYEEAQDVIETHLGDYVEEILTLDSLAKILRKKRYESGSVEFDRAEVKFDIDEKGHPTGVYFKVSKDANKLIEEFMLLANKTVACHVGAVKGKKKAKAFVYRVHDMPDATKLEDLAKVARTFGYKVKVNGSPREVNRSINKMLNDIKNAPEENYLATLAIRSMAKAIYSTDNIGHYGLGFEYYTHFTSPIRRYPDMLVHRLLARYLDGGRSVNLQKLEDECKHDSDMEQLASNAERSSIKYKQVEYMRDHLGEEYAGMISGVTEWGLYVELEENLCEGLIPMRDLADDYYDFDESNHCLVGRRSKTRYRLGDKIKVRVARADLDKKQLDFVLADAPVRRQDEDQMGRKVSVQQALSSGGKEKSKTKSRSRSGKGSKSPKRH